MKIVVLAGGLSTERDVSFISAAQVCRALRSRGHQAVVLDIFLGYGKEGDDLSGIFDGEESLIQISDHIPEEEPDLEAVRALRDGEDNSLFGPNVTQICRMADIVYLGLHGADGENGKVQAAFDVLGIRYTGSGYFGSAMAMDKGVAKKMLQSGGVPTPKGFTLEKDMADAGQMAISEIGFPCVVKPCCGGSSVGVSIAVNGTELRGALELAFGYGDEVVVEEYIRGREFAVGILDGKALPVIEIIPKKGFYDYRTKYQAGMAREVCPAELDDHIARQMQELALAAFCALKLEVYGRIDFLLSDDGRLYCLEANTLPGMTPFSLLPQEAAAVGIEYGELCEKIIAGSLKRKRG